MQSAAASWAVPLIAAVILGAAGGLILPRGAVTTPQALLTVVWCLLLGLATGLLIRSRWSLLVVPAVFVAANELGRLSVDGPTVDAGWPDGLYGLLVLVVGRGVDALLTLLPLLVGVGLGQELARRRDQRPPGRAVRPVRRGILIVGCLAVLALVAGLLRPVGTDPIVGADGEPVAGSVAELVTARVGGHDQHLMIRGHDATAPVLLFLEGGPGGSALGRMRRSAGPLEEHFVVVTWDQRGTGKSYAALEPTATLTVERATADTLEVIDHLRDRFDQDRVYVVGSSWGSILGVLAARQRPEVFHALIGTGQMVDPFETDQLMYAENLAQAHRTGDTSRVERLRQLGAPPYDDPLDYLEALAGNPEWMGFPHGADYDPASEYPMAFFVREYSLIEQLRGMAALAETYAVLYPQLAELDLRRDAVELDVPVYLLQGEHEAGGREVLAREWFELLEAPEKEWVTLERSGHTPPYDEPGRFAEILAEVALQNP